LKANSITPHRSHPGERLADKKTRQVALAGSSSRAGHPPVTVSASLTTPLFAEAWQTLSSDS
jgi:hypothetical protein